MFDVHCAVVGSPIAHSRSPLLHRAAYAALGLTGWTYDRVELRGPELLGWLSDLDESWRGVSVTMPVKQAALACADTASELASMLGAANTLLRTERGWHADNTDVAGLLGALDEVSKPGGGATSATVLGAGGTASAAVAALAALGHKHLGVVVRDPTRADALLALVDRLGMTGLVHPWPGTQHPGSALLRRSSESSPCPTSPLAADLVISTVPGAATTALLGHQWRAAQTVLDVSYDPWPTALVSAAGAQGSRVIGGAAVLLWQAVRQVELVTGLPAPVEAMRAALLPGGSLAPA